MRLKFVRNEDNFVILAATGEYKIKLLELFVEFRKIGTDVGVLSRELALLNKGEPYRMPFLQAKQFAYTVPEGRGSFMLNDLCTGDLPRHLLVSFVRHDSFNSDKSKNGYIFENLNISSLVFKVNGENSPPSEYKPNFKSVPLDCLREYQHLMNAIGVKRLNSGVAITVADFAKTSCFFVLDLTPEQCNNSHLHGKYHIIYQLIFLLRNKTLIFAVGKSGNINLHITFATRTDTPYQLLGYGIYPKAALIDATGNCKLADNI